MPAVGVLALPSFKPVKRNLPSLSVTAVNDAEPPAVCVSVTVTPATPASPVSKTPLLLVSLKTLSPIVAPASTNLLSSEVSLIPSTVAMTCTLFSFGPAAIAVVVAALYLIVIRLFADNVLGMVDEFHCRVCRPAELVPKVGLAETPVKALPSGNVTTALPVT